jgi:hypothetical protein
MRGSRLSRFTSGMLGVLVFFGSAVAAIGQRAPIPSPLPAAPPEASDSLNELNAKVRELDAALDEMREEIARSRREAQELGRGLAAAREQLASLKREIAPPAAQGSENSSTQAGSEPTGSGSLNAQMATLDHRVQAIEDDRQLQDAKVDDQYQTKIESGSKYRVRFSGIALLNIFGTRGSVNNLDLPTAAQPRSPLDSSGSFGASVRQSQLGLDVSGPTVGGAKTSGDIQFDFFGGFPNTVDGVTAGLVRLRTARIRFDWSHTSIVAGQDGLFFSPLSPTSFASFAYPALAYAGNLWTWTPQVRIEHSVMLSDNSSVLLQGGILDSLSGEPPGQAAYYRVPQAGERSREPAYAVRLAWSRAAEGRSAAIGAGGYYARQDWGFGRTVDSWVTTADWDLPLGQWLALSGEIYRGRAIGGLGGGTAPSVLFSGVLTDPSTSVLALNSAGGWAQLKWRATEKMELNGVFGEDYPFQSDLGYFRPTQNYLGNSFGRNASGFVNVIYHARSNLLMSIEYRRLWTSQLYRPNATADQVNLGAGVMF